MAYRTTRALARNAIGVALACSAAAVALVPPRTARACGGCFHPEDQAPEQSSVVTAHRMALSISSTQTVLWDQVAYAGSPAEFAWVLPVKPGASVEVASDAWFEALDAATATRVSAPALACESPDVSGPGCGGPVAQAGCSADEAAGGEPMYLQPPPDPVTVVHEGSVGPYETVTLHSDVPGALSDWLVDHGFRIDDDIQPIIDSYSSNGFDFIALRLLPEVGVQQMRPVRVIQPGAAPTLPLRMVAAGTGANVQLTLFVLGEARWRTMNFPELLIAGSELTWDFDPQRSDYAAVRENKLVGNGGGWLTSYSQPGALLSPVPDPVTGAAVPYQTATGVSSTIADAFVQQAIANGETIGGPCAQVIASLAQSDAKVVDPCPVVGAEPCGPLQPGEVDALSLVCPPVPGNEIPLDDLAVALTGMHPRDVWVTRLEANLPRAALAADLALTPADNQVPVAGWLVAEKALSEPCPLASGASAAALSRGGRGPSRRDLGFVSLFAVAGALLWARRRKPEVVPTFARTTPP
jgi:hypothetical protein